LCGGARSQADYLILAGRFATLLLSGVPVFDGDSLQRDALRRFIWLIDILYDSRVKFICAANAPLDGLFSNGADGEAARTLSRLVEMQSAAYFNNDNNDGDNSAGNFHHDDGVGKPAAPR
jgi:cell division protein ZapE